MNLYLYLPFASAHPQGCIKGTVYGLTRRYYLQNSHRSDYVRIVSLLYRRLCARGWEPTFIKSLILDASKRIETASTSPPKQSTAGDSNRIADDIYIHLQYHPDDISRRQLRTIYDEHLAHHFENTLKVKRAIVAYSRPKNIGDYVTQAKLHQAAGITASTTMGECEQGLHP